MVESPRLIGRQAEMAALTELVERGRPGLVLLTGGPGTGKSIVLRELRTRVATYHCRVVPNAVDDMPWLVVDRRSTADDLLRAVEGSGGDDGKDAERDTWQSQRRQALDLVLIHGYRPDDNLQEWFAQEFINGAGPATPRLVVVAGSPGDVAAIEPLAYASVTIGPPDRDAVVAELHHLDARLDDPLEAHELGLYADAITAEPALLDALERVLPLSSAPPGRERETFGGEISGNDARV